MPKTFVLDFVNNVRNRPQKIEINASDFLIAVPCNFMVQKIYLFSPSMFY